MTTQPDFERARREPAYRQAFIDSLDLGDLRDRVAGVRYASTTQVITPRNKGHNAQDALAATVWKPEFTNGSLKERPTIFVYDALFDTHTYTTQEDALSAIYDHEGTHVIQLYNRRFDDGIFDVEGFIHAQRKILGDAIQVSATQNAVKSPLNKMQERLVLFAFAWEAIKEQPAYDAQLTGKHGGRISLAVREDAEFFRDMHTIFIETFDEMTDGMTTGMRQTPYACYNKLCAMPQVTMERMLERIEEKNSHPRSCETTP